MCILVIEILDHALEVSDRLIKGGNFGNMILCLSINLYCSLRVKSGSVFDVVVVFDAKDSGNLHSESILENEYCDELIA